MRRAAMEGLVAAWLAQQQSDRTRGAYRSDLTSYTGWCEQSGRDPLAADSAALGAYRDACLAEGASSATVSRRLSAIASFFRHAVAAGEAPTNPADAVARPDSPTEPPPALDDEELESLLDAAQRLGPKTAALVALLALDGLKLNEALAINVPHVRLDPPPTISVERRGVRQPIPITGHSAELVGSQIANRRRGPLFLGDSPTRERADRLTRFGADFLIKRAGAEAELDKAVSANLLRRSYIGAAHRAGTAMEDIAQQVGHRQVRDTARYLPPS